MWIVLLSALVISSVQALVIINPYRSLVFYNTAQSPLRNQFVQRYLLFMNTNYNGRFITYSLPQPVYVIRVNNYSGSSAVDMQDKGINEFKKAQEAHFRAWSLQQYQALKLEIDVLRAEGKEPSVEMLLRFIPLQKIALTANYSTIAELPEIKQIRQEHFNIWKNVRISDLQYLSENESNAQEQLNTYNGKLDELLKLFENGKLEFDKLEKINADIKTLEEINTSNAKIDAMQKSFHRRSENVKNSEKDNHIGRPYLPHNKVKFEQLNNTEASEDFKVFKTDIITDIPKPEIIFVNRSKNSDDATDKPELLFVAGVECELGTTEIIKEEDLTTERQEIDTTTKKDNDENQEQTTMNQQTTEVTTQEVFETTEVQTIQQDHFLSIIDPKLKKDAKNKIDKLISDAPQIYVPQQFTDTREVERVRDEHLSIVTQAILKSKLTKRSKTQ